MRGVEVDWARAVRGRRAPSGSGCRPTPSSASATGSTAAPARGRRGARPGRLGRSSAAGRRGRAGRRRGLAVHGPPLAASAPVAGRPRGAGRRAAAGHGVRGAGAARRRPGRVRAACGSWCWRRRWCWASRRGVQFQVVGRRARTRPGSRPVSDLLAPGDVARATSAERGVDASRQRRARRRRRRGAAARCSSERASGAGRTSLAAGGAEAVEVEDLYDAPG